MAQAMAWSSRVTTIALEMVVPPVVGHWLDQKLGTWALFVSLGAIFGMTAGLLHLIQMTKPEDDDATDGDDSES